VIAGIIALATGVLIAAAIGFAFARAAARGRQTAPVAGGEGAQSGAEVGPDRDVRAAGGVESTDLIESPASSLAGAPPRWVWRELSAWFHKAIGAFEHRLGGPEARYQMPWFLLVRDGQTPDRPLLANPGWCRLLSDSSKDTQLSQYGVNCRLWLVNGGLFVEVDSGYLSWPVGRADGAVAWRRFLSVLNRERSQRPLDGVLLAVSIAGLRDDHAEDMGPADRAGEVERALRELRGRLGMDVPVYTLFTDCERLPGFSGFADTLPAPATQGMFGWSNPHAVDAVFREEWIGDAFAALDLRTRQLETELLAGDVDADLAEELVSFPRSLATLEPGVRIYLSRVFASGNAGLFRGLYLCGAAGPGRAAHAGPGFLSAVTQIWRPEEPKAAPPRERTLFLRDLIHRKLIPEAGLAKPRSAGERERRIALAGKVALAAAAATLLIGTWASYRGLRENRAAARSLIERIGADTAEIRRVQSSGEEPEAALMIRHTDHVLSGLAPIERGYLGSAFLPSSWLSSVPDQLRRALGQGLSDLVLRSMFHQLHRRTDDLAGAVAAQAPKVAVDCHPAERRAGGDIAADASASPVRWDSSAQFQELSGFAAEVERLSDRYRDYNGLGSASSLAGLRALARDLFGMELPKGFFRHPEVVVQALSAASYTAFVPDLYRRRLRRRAHALVQEFYRALLGNSSLLVQLDALSLDLQELGREDQWNRSAEGAARVKSALARIEWLERTLTDDSSSWAFASKLNLGPRFDRILVALQRSPLVAGSASVEQAINLAEYDLTDLRDSAALPWRDFQRCLASYSAPVTGPLLVRDGAGRATRALSPQLLSVKEALAAVLNEPFAVESSPRSFRTEIPAGTRLVWDTRILAQASALAEPYSNFRQERLNSYAARLRPALDSAARRLLAEKLADLIARAQTLESSPAWTGDGLQESEVRGRVQGYLAGAQPLRKLLPLLRELEVGTLSDDLTDLLVGQGVGLLGDVDHVLRAEAPYQPRDPSFSWWDGDGPVGYEAFGVANEAELSQFVERERTRLTEMATAYAEPVLAELAAIGVRGYPEFQLIYRKWRSITDRIAARGVAAPGEAGARGGRHKYDSLGALERFLVSDLPKVRLESCMGATERGRGSDDDFFAATLADLRQALRARCEALIVERAPGYYREVAQAFDERLRGRYPFSGSAPGPFTAEVHADDIRGFYEVFDGRAGVLRAAAALPRTSAASPGDDATVFIADMSAVRGFFAEFLATEDRLQSPTYKLNVEFRVNRDREIGAKHIIEWKLDVGTRTVRHHDENRRVTWSPGQPIRFSLRWAKDSSRIPVTRDERGLQAPPERTASFAFLNRWSLLELIRNHEVSDRRPHTMEFEVDTVLLGKNQRIGRPSRALVYVRITLSPSSSTKSLTVPRFPDEAPMWRHDISRLDATSRR
jgi:type VI secretion system protein ImpL